jgi:hypothetical protein
MVFALASIFCAKEKVKVPTTKVPKSILFKNFIFFDFCYWFQKVSQNIM